MSNPADRRRYPRMNTLGGGYCVHFRIQEREVRNAPLANLSACGCGIEVQMTEAIHLDMGSLLEDLYLDHPDLPFVPLQGSVVRVLGKVAGKTSGYVLVGIDFTHITPFIRELIQGHVLEHTQDGEGTA